MADGNWNKVRAELADIWVGLRTEKSEQPGWTHAYMQAWRTITRRGPVTLATILGIGGPVFMVALAVAVIS